MSAVEANAAKLLLAHGRDLEPGLRQDLEVISKASIGAMVKLGELYAARHLDERIEIAQQREMERGRTPNFRMTMER
ncbi:hypothetical protein G7066_00695 [Leucobacter coleopterorum]|uniref:Uncharacterized protein n=1 Tax=Leucobacter coleopterorum TaxID=2714933 RepID=A0ABX6JTK3_9MICO|nr:hypothetical protein [Leucobacter coleopterorum]QIM17597.1 hypothetical protein G7066_00695 [Leucobacter coleopterorum]